MVPDAGLVYDPATLDSSITTDFAAARSTLAGKFGLPMSRPLRNYLVTVGAAVALLALPLPQVGRVGAAVFDLAHPLIFAFLAYQTLNCRC